MKKKRTREDQSESLDTRKSLSDSSINQKLLTKIVFTVFFLSSMINFILIFFLRDDPFLFEDYFLLIVVQGLVTIGGLVLWEFKRYQKDMRREMISIVLIIAGIYAWLCLLNLNFLAASFLISSLLINVLSSIIAESIREIKHFFFDTIPRIYYKYRLFFLICGIFTFCVVLYLPVLFDAGSIFLYYALFLLCLIAFIVKTIKIEDISCKIENLGKINA